MAPRSICQPLLAADAAAMGSSSRLQQAARLDESTQSSMAPVVDPLLAADAAIQAAKHASAAASAAAAAVAFAPKVSPLPSAEVGTTPAKLLEQVHHEPLERQTGAASGQLTSNGGGAPSSSTPTPMQQLASAPASGARPARGSRLPPGLLLEPSLPEHDIAPGQPTHALKPRVHAPAA